MSDNRLLYTLLMVCFLLCFSCSKEREVVFPKDLDLISRDSATSEEFKDYTAFNKTFVAFVGHQSPKTQLYRIELALKDVVEKGMGYMIYVSGTEPSEIKRILEELEYDFAVYADVNSQFKEVNEIDESLRYTGFIINRKGRYLSSPLIHMRN